MSPTPSVHGVAPGLPLLLQLPAATGHEAGMWLSGCLAALAEHSPPLTVYKHSQAWREAEGKYAVLIVTHLVCFPRNIGRKARKELSKESEPKELPVRWKCRSDIKRSGEEVHQHFEPVFPEMIV